MKIDDRLLFLKYALPCAGTLVKRGKVSQEYVDKLTELVSNGKVPKEEAEHIFRVATAMCNVIAEREGKTSIDDQVIRRYFLLEHSKVVEDRYELMGDFDPIACKTYFGTVLGVKKGTAVVQTPIGKKTYRTDFARDLKAGDKVAVHWNFVIEKVPKAFLKRMQ